MTDRSSPRRPMKAAVWYRRNTTEPADPPAAVAALTARGYVVVAAELCGFGEAGDAFGTGGFFPVNVTAGLYGGAMMASEGAENMAHEIGRSVPGIHAGDVVRLHRWLRGRHDVEAVELALAQDWLDVAVVHALIADPASAPPKVALIRPQASLSAAAANRFYDPHACARASPPLPPRTPGPLSRKSDLPPARARRYYSWVPRLLERYDVADAVAAAAADPATNTSLLLLGPVDQLLRPLTPPATAAAYAFGVAAAGGGRLTVEAGNFSVGLAHGALERVLAWAGRKN